MERVKIKEVKEVIKDLPKKKQINILLIASTHGVSRYFIERIKKEIKIE